MNDVTQWRFGKVAERLLGGRIQWSPPPDWACWVEPTPLLPIDRLLTTLRQSNRPARLRSREELEARGIPCPFYAVRWAIGMAVDAATVAAHDDATEMARRWRLHEQSAEQAASSVATIAQSLITTPPVTRWPVLEPPDVDAAYQVIFALHRSAGLARVAAHARQARQIFLNNQGDVWRAVFAADLGFTWRVLTGSDPTRSDPFIGFVAAAFDSITDDPETVSWERAVRRALELGLDWGRYEK